MITSVTVPHTKLLDPADYIALDPWVSQVGFTRGVLDKVGLAPELGSEHRRWEYAMALRAIEAWGKPKRVLEFGGGDSLLMPTLQRILGEGVEYTSVEAPEWAVPTNLERQRAQNPYPLRQLTSLPEGETFDVVLAVSVLENMPLRYKPNMMDSLLLVTQARSPEEAKVMFGQANQVQALRPLALATGPGGLLFFTSDIMESTAKGDTAHFHWMRPSGIWCPNTWALLAQATCQECHCGKCSDTWELLGGVADFTWRGAHVYNYSFAAMALKRTK